MSQELWNPLSVPEVADLLKAFGRPWWVAGGIAIDHFIGKKTREHSDLDILIQRSDQQAAQVALAGWDLRAADPPGSLRSWKAGEILPAEVHVIWGRPEFSGPWRLELMLLDVEGENWIYRRDRRIWGPVSAMTQKTSGDIQYLAPEIQLLYKSKSIRDKDQQDFENTLPLLSHLQRAWLKNSLEIAYQGVHPWADRLAENR